ncbi:MAG: sigma-70 family RNA polymerase sigma factor [Oscillospiraceae bacterium]|jgi:RNA polymerase sigma-70 factor (ECF subfamily)|nr:sigma-70 family RNA polymerase sigma factor [Oscillospiraceae bacterium]
MLALYISALETDEERDKFAYLYEENYRLLMNVARRIVRSSELAEEVVHDTFVTALEQKEKFLSLDAVNFRNFCVRVIRNKCIDILRRNKPLNGAVALDAEDSPDLISDETPFELRLVSQEDYARLMACVAELDPINRQILEMKYVHDLPFEEICSELNMTFPQVNGRLARTRAKVKALFEKEP